jgi:hypothetical protein
VNNVKLLLKYDTIVRAPIQSIGAIVAATAISRATILKACTDDPLKACAYASGEIWLIDTNSEQFATWLAAHPTQKRVKGHQMKEKILEALFLGEEMYLEHKMGEHLPPFSAFFRSVSTRFLGAFGSVLDQSKGVLGIVGEDSEKGSVYLLITVFLDLEKGRWTFACSL